jgi:Uma2 family endonuclease
MAMATDLTRWTLDEVLRLPDDGNRYELIDGELYVTPPPTEPHETIAARLTRRMDPYVERHGLGYIYRPKAVVRIGDRVQVEPDLMVRAAHPHRDRTWETAPLPILVVEILSPSTWQRDYGVKRALYRDSLAIPDYWVVDGERRAITVIRPGKLDVTVTDRVVWQPAGVAEPLALELSDVFDA